MKKLILVSLVVLLGACQSAYYAAWEKVGVEKRDLMEKVFTEEDLKQQQRLKCAFDPNGLLNPGKVFPTLHRCAELGRVHIHHGQTPFSDIPRF